MADIELPASFYLGREYDLKAKKVLDQPVMYEARDLCTHGVVVGMTGSGKTGLCIGLIEEAAIDGIPCIIIDLKGDLSNLLLQFPELRPENFEPWVNADEARRKKRTPKEHAVELAKTWKNGLAAWGQGPERIARLKQSSDWRIYTPGSEAGLPISVLQTFSAPKGKTNREALNEKVDATTTALLGLTNVVSDPVQSREHILIAHLLLNSWMKGKDMDLPQIITQIQAPPLRKIGAFDVDLFFPEKERLKLAMSLNNLLASPTFSSWVAGEPLELSAMLYTKDGRPRQLIFYLAHLDDSQRMFFLTLLLEEVLTWTRAQPGSTSLRAIVYLDEVFGYLPPHPHNPPTKRPLLTLLKQARAFGVGMLLATQNPVDLDYKALSNAGTWFVGKLQTERDKARLLEGLEGVAAAQGTLTDRRHLDTVISSLGSRVFLYHNVHAGKPALMQTRWAMSYLFGPMTRDQIVQVMKPIEQAMQAEAEGGETAGRPCPQCGKPVPGQAKFCMECGARVPLRVESKQEDQFKEGLQPAKAGPEIKLDASHVPPVLPAGMVQYFLSALPLASPAGQMSDAKLHYEPRLLASAEVKFSDARKGFDQRQPFRLLMPAPEPGQPIAWNKSEPLANAPGTSPEGYEATWGDVPEAINDPKKLKALEKSFVDFVSSQAKVIFYQNKELELTSEPGEDHDDFLKRCQEAAKRAGDEEMAREKEEFRVRFDAIDERLDESEAKASQTREAARQTETAITVGEAVWGLSWLFGKKRSRIIPRPATGQLRSVQRRAEKAETELSKHQNARDKLETEWRLAVEKINDKWHQNAEDIKEIRLTPKKADIRVTQFGLAWAPFWVTAEGRRLAAYEK
jgi:hypothetical protein